MDGSDADVLERMRDNAGAFEAQQDHKDNKVNDGENYKGMMSVADYRKKRQEVLEGVDEESKKRAKMVDAAVNAVKADRAAAAQAEEDRIEREKQRKEKLQKQLQESEAAAEGAGSSSSSGAAAGKKKKKRKATEAAGLSFDADEEG